MSHNQFITLYNDPKAKTLRKKVESLVKAYNECDWVDALEKGTGAPQTTLVSIYKYIESELRALGLLGEAPEAELKSMENQAEAERKIAELQEEIEEYVFKLVATSTVENAPYMHSAASTGPAQQYESLAAVSTTDRRTSNESGKQPRPAARPADYLRRPPRPAPLQAVSPLNERIAALRAVTLWQLGLAGGGSSGGPQGLSEVAAVRKENRRQRALWVPLLQSLCAALSEPSPGLMLQALAQFQRQLARRVKAYIKGENACGVENGEGEDVTADELTPALIWVVIQANPPHVAARVWLAGEFRHPSLLHGEQAYCLSQLDSAAAFCRRAGPQELGMTETEYTALLARHAASQTLLRCCRAGGPEEARECLEQEADCNALSVDQQSSPLSLCVSLGRETVFDLLLDCGTDVNCCVAPFHSSPSVPLCTTPLHLAAQHGRPRMLLALLRAGAIRAAEDGAGSTPLLLATSLRRASASSPRVREAARQMELLLGTDTAGRQDALLTLLLTASSEGAAEIAVALLAQGVRLDERALRTEELTATLPAASEVKALSPLMALQLRADCSLLTRVLCAGAALGVPLRPALQPLLPDGSALTVSCAVLSAQLLARECRLWRATPAEESTSAHQRAHAQLLSLAALLQADERPAGPCDQWSAALDLLQLGAEHEAELSAAPDWAQAAAAVTLTQHWTDPAPITEGLLLGEGEKYTQQLRACAMAALEYRFTIIRDPLAVGGMETGLETHIDTVMALLLSPELPLVLASELLRARQRGGRPGPGAEAGARSRRSLAVWAALCLARCGTAAEDLGPALLASAAAGDTHTVALLLRREACANLGVSASPHYFTPPLLAAAAATGEEVQNMPLLEELYPAPAPPVPPALSLDAVGADGSALHVAARLVNRPLVSLLLAAGASRRTVPTPSSSGVSEGEVLDIAEMLQLDPREVPVCLAARHGDWRVLRALLLQGVSINSRHLVGGDELCCPLIAAAAHSQVALVEQLLAVELGGSLQLPVHLRLEIDATDSRGRTALMHAAGRRDEAIVLLLLRHGCDRHRRDHSGRDAEAHVWAREGEVQYEQLLAEHRRAERLAAVLHFDPALLRPQDAARVGRLDALAALFKQGVSPAVPLDPLSEPAIVVVAASASSAYSIPRAELSPGCTPLMAAAASLEPGALAALQLLLRAPEVLRSLEAADFAQGWTALMHAAAAGHEPAVLALLRAGASRTQLDNSGRSAEDLALALGHDAVAALLHADPRKVLVHEACAAGQTRVVQALLRQGCPITFRDERPDKLRQTPLMAACAAGKYAVVTLLLKLQSEYGPAGLNERDARGRTPLMLAARAGALDVTALLLAAGCTRDLTDDGGRTAAGHAALHGTTTYLQYEAQLLIH